VIPTKIGASGAKGDGVFATGPIPASTRVATFRGKVCWIWDIPEELWPHAFQVDYDRYTLGRKNSVGWLINHSCEPNCVITGMSLVAARRVLKGEELTFDYSTDVDWPGYKMECSCESPQCRGVVRAYRFLPKEVKVRYGRHVAPFILKKYGPPKA
jgi:SET domain-containing protein